MSLTNEQIGMLVAALCLLMTSLAQYLKTLSIGQKLEENTRTTDLTLSHAIEANIAATTASKQVDGIAMQLAASSPPPNPTKEG